jgi:hypothetical protein
MMPGIRFNRRASNFGADGEDLPKQKLFCADDKNKYACTGIQRDTGWLGVLGTVAAIYSALQSWRIPQRWWAARVRDTLIVLACLGGVWFVFTWNMLHWRVK